MTLRLTLGIDPGQTGAIAALADGEPAGFIDMPTHARAAGGQMVDAGKLAAAVRGMVMQHQGAYVYGVIEAVAARPGQGGSSMFRFGQSDGIVRGVFGALGILLIEVQPQTWKRYLRIEGKAADPDAARKYAMSVYPGTVDFLMRKKDSGRADGLCIARWAELTEQVARAA